MGNYLKKFKSHTQYENYINGNDIILPNVSMCTIEGDVHYNPYIEENDLENDPRVICKYYINNNSQLPYNISLFSSDIEPENFSKIDIDGIEIDVNNNNFYEVNSYGEHVAKLNLIDQTIITNYSFMDGIDLIEVIIPNSVISIGDWAFSQCYYLENVILSNNIINIGNSAFYYTGIQNINIPDTVTSIGDSAFNYCGSLISVIVNATTPPTLGTDVFTDVNDNCKIYVPSQSVETYKATSGWSDYANKIQAIS